MSDLAATNCGCGCGCENSNTTGGCCNWIWIILLLSCCGGCGNNSCMWILILLLCCGGCGNGTNFLNGCGNNGCGC